MLSKKIPEFVEARNRNWEHLREKLDVLSDKIIMPEKITDSEPSWSSFWRTEIFRPEISFQGVILNIRVLIKCGNQGKDIGW